jgi:hypothetical protein
MVQAHVANFINFFDQCSQFSSKLECLSSGYHFLSINLYGWHFSAWVGSGFAHKL